MTKSWLWLAAILSIKNAFDSRKKEREKESKKRIQEK